MTHASALACVHLN